MQAASKIYVVGIGYKPLGKQAREIIYDSEIILASSRLYEVFKEYEEFEAVKDKIKVINNVDETINFIKSQISSRLTLHASRFIVLLASGDPMFFGIGRRVVKEFGKESVEILPDLSSNQIAFARIKEPWDDAFLISLHRGPDPEKRRRLEYEIGDIPSLLDKHKKIAILTDKINNPTEIAKVLNSSLITRRSSLTMYICERLGYPDERIIEGRPEEIAGMKFRDPNVVIIMDQKDSNKLQVTNNELTNDSSLVTRHWSLNNAYCLLPFAPNFGLKEDEIIHSRGLITKDEVRAVTIHKLRPPQKGVFWDIGAGSGSVSIEVGRLFPELKVFAIERDEEQIDNIRKNKIKFNAQNIEIIKGQAPDVLAGLQPPERVFIGGSGGRLKEIIEMLGRIGSSMTVVINATTVETLNEAINELNKRGFEVDVAQIMVSRLKVIGEGNFFSALNPVFVIRGEK